MAMEEEIRELEQRFADSPESRLFLPLADALMRSGELQRAVEICSRGLESYPDFTSARVLLAQCLMGLGLSEKAREHFELVLADDSGNIEALKGLGNLAAESGDAETARGFFVRAQGIEPLDEQVADAVEALRVDAGGRGSEPSAEDERNSGEGEVFITHTLGDIYRLQGHYQRAFEVYSRLLERNPDDKALAARLNEVAVRLGPAAGRVPGVAAEAGSQSEPDVVPDDVADVRAGDEVAMRIDNIFEAVLNEPVEPAGGEINGPGSFVNTFERWIKGLKLLEAG